MYFVIQTGTVVILGGFSIGNLANSAPVLSNQVAEVTRTHGSVLLGELKRNSFMKVLKESGIVWKGHRDTRLLTDCSH